MQSKPESGIFPLDGIKDKRVFEPIDRRSDDIHSRKSWRWLSTADLNHVVRFDHLLTFAQPGDIDVGANRTFGCLYNLGTSIIRSSGHDKHAPPPLGGTRWSRPLLGGTCLSGPWRYVGLSILLRRV